MVTQERTRRLGQVKFVTFEDEITSGEIIALKGWWKAAQEAIERHGLVRGCASKYAEEAAKVATRNKENTIRQYVGALLTLIERGHTLDEFVKQGLGIEHARETARGYSTRKPVEKKNVKSDVAFDALFRTKEFKALPAKAQKALRLLAKGESFHSNLI